MMRRTRRWPAGAGQFRERNPCTREDRPGSVSREPFGELLDSSSSSTAHDGRVRWPRRWIKRIDGHHVAIILEKVVSAASVWILKSSELIQVQQSGVTARQPAWRRNLPAAISVFSGVIP